MHEEQRLRAKEDQAGGSGVSAAQDNRRLAYRRLTQRLSRLLDDSFS